MISSEGSILAPEEGDGSNRFRAAEKPVFSCLEMDNMPQGSLGPLAGLPGDKMSCKIR